MQFARILTIPLARLAIILGLLPIAVAVLVGCKAFSQSMPAAFSTVQDVPLPGDTSRFDYASLDPGTHRLYIAHLGAGTVPVYDTSAGAIVGEVRDVPGVHGVLAVPELGRVYATATDSNQVAVIDPQSLSVVTTIPGGTYPDGLAYDPEVGKLYVSDESGGTDTVIDIASNQVVATVPLGGDVGNTQFDVGSHQILVAVQGRNQVVTIDPQTAEIVRVLVRKRGAGVAQGVIGQSWPLEVQPPQMGVDDGAYAAAAEALSAGAVADGGHERHAMLITVNRTARRKVGFERLADVLAQVDHTVVAFAADQQDPLVIATREVLDVGT